jgi:hypothetical protein
LATTITFSNGVRSEVVLFCQPGEDIGRLLMGPEPFVPIEHDGKVRLVARKTLAVVTMPRGHDFDEEATLVRRVTVTVRLTSGNELDGELAYTPRHERPRVLDFLNESDAIVCLSDPHGVHHISKEHIASVEER